MSTLFAHFRCAENSGLTSFSDYYLTDGLTITWSADVNTIWAQRQDTYPGNALYDWWEITGDPVMYPYPVAGFDVHHKGGTFNDCESSYAPEAFPIGSPNGVDHTITMLADHGAIVSHGSLDTSTPTYVHPTITLTAGTFRDVLFADGTSMQLREGDGSNLYDADDVLVGTLNGDPEPWWAGEYQVAQSIIDAEAVQGQNVFTDGKGHPLPMTQQAMEELGQERVENGAMIGSIDGWVNPATTRGTVSYDVGKLKIVNDGADANPLARQLITGMTVGAVYRLTLWVDAGDANIISVTDPSGVAGEVISGVSTRDFTASAETGNLSLYIAEAGNTGHYAYFDNVSIREVNQIINNNNQYYFCEQLLVYKRVLSDEEDMDVLVFCGKAEAVGVNGVAVGVNGVPVGVRI